MTTQLDQKIEELSTRIRTLVDRLSVLERENRMLREKYRDALERLDEPTLELAAVSNERVKELIAMIDD